MKAACVFACLALAGLPQFAAAQNESELAQRAQRAERVVVGTIVDVDAVFETNEYGDQLIVSKVTLRVDETLKGPDEESVEVSVEGGTIGDLTLEVSDMPTVKRGERAAFFLYRAPGGSLVPRDRGLGIAKLNASDRVEGTDMTLDDIRQAVRGGR